MSYKVWKDWVRLGKNPFWNIFLFQWYVIEFEWLLDAIDTQVGYDSGKEPRE